MMAAFFTAGIAFLVAGAAAALIDAFADWPTGHWLALHLLFVGGVSQLVLGAGQFFAGAFLATDPPPKWLIGLQLGAWNAGTPLVAVGVTQRLDGVTVAGAALLAVGLAAFLTALRGLRRRSLQQRPWAVRWYQACATFLGAGVIAGVLMATDLRWTSGSLLGAHMTLNLAGWFGTAIAGTLHTFFPSLTQTRLRFARLERPTFACWTAGVTALAAGYAFADDPAIVAGWAALTVAAGLLSANLVASLRAAPGVVGLPARLVTLAQGFLVLALGIALVSALAHDPMAGLHGATRTATAILLLPGWLGLTVAGALLHLLAVLARVRDLSRPLPVPRPARDRALSAAALLGVLALAGARSDVLPGVDAPALGVLLAAYVVLAALVLARFARAAGARNAKMRAP
jgi:hypothetical protein